MREQSLIDFQESSLVVDKKIKDVLLILSREIAYLHPILCQLCQS